MALVRKSFYLHVDAFSREKEAKEGMDGSINNRSKEVQAIGGFSLG